MFSVGDGPAVTDHPAVQVQIGQVADGQHALVTILPLWLARNRRLPDLICQREGRSFAAAP